MKKLADFYNSNKEGIDENTVTIAEYFSRKSNINEAIEQVDEDFTLKKKGNMTTKKYAYNPSNKDELIQAMREIIDRKFNPEKYVNNENDNSDIQTTIIEKMPNDTLDFNSINTSEITDMSYIFKECMARIGWQTQSKLQKEIKEIDISDWDASNVTTLEGLFYIHHRQYEMLSNIQIIDMTGWNTSNVKNMEFLFHGLNSLTEIRGISDFDFDKCKTVNSMFFGCNKLKELDLSGWKPIFVEDYGSLFEECASLTRIDGIEDFKINRKVKKNPKKYLANMFFACSTNLQRPTWYINLMGEN